MPSVVAKGKVMKCAAAIFATVVCLGASADTWTDPETGVEWTYTVLDGEASLGGSGSQTAITNNPTGVLSIPDTLGGCPVTGIGNWALGGLNITGVVIPDGVRNIGYGAFYRCTNLARVAFPQGVTNIADRAFYYCDGLEEVVFPDGLASMGSDAFTGCRGIKSVTLSQYACSRGSGLFWTASRYIETITLSASVTNFNAAGFSSFGGLKSILVQEGNASYSSVNGLLLSKDGKELVRGVNGDVVIPDGVVSVGRCAFTGCTNLVSVTIPDAVADFGEWAFKDCSRLAGLSLPSNMTRVASHMFSGCAQLKSVVIPEGVTSIGQYAFEKCRALTSVTVPRSLAYSEMHAFSDCVNLAAVHITDVESWCRIAFEGAGGNPLYCGPALYLDGSAITDLSIPACITEIKDNAFHGCGGLVSVTIHDGVAGIGASAFESCSGLRRVRLPDGMASIGAALFRNCGALAEVTIPSGVTSIGGYSFQGCGEIECVTIPRGVTDIGDYAFEGCRSLTNIVFMGNAPTVAWWSSGLIPRTFNGVGESCEVYVSKKSTGWGVSVGDEWLGMTLQYWPEVLTPVDSIAAARGVVSEFADERVAACVESLDDYARLAAWAGEKDIYQPALKDSPHAWSSFALGTAALLENEPGIELGDVSVVTDAGSVPSMTISVVVRDGDSMVLADSAKVAEMFEAAGDLADWTGSALAPDVRCVGVYDGVMRFAVGLGDVPDGRAFLRIRKEP